MTEPNPTTAPDAELDGLILAHASTVHQHPQDSFALGKTHQAIRAHVEKVKREARAEGERAAPLAVSVKTYHHNIPTSDNPEDHSEGNCLCDPIVDEAAGTVTHQPMPALDAASGPDAGTPDAELDRLLIEYARCQVLARERNAIASSAGRDRLAYAVECAAAAIHAHVKQVRQEAHDIGFRRGLREVGQEIAAPGMTDLMVPPETIPDYQPPE